jgi:hypothetical protein
MRTSALTAIPLSTLPLGDGDGGDAEGPSLTSRVRAVRHDAQV